jgi:branched-chain amino acid transport system permease protein
VKLVERVGLARDAGARRALPGLWAVAAVVLLALIAFPLISPGDTYHQNVLFSAFLLGVMALSWNVVSGYAGYISLGHSAFLGVGAYTAALLSLHLGISPFVLAPLGGVAAAILALLVGSVVMRARGHAFVIITIALVLTLQVTGLNLGSFTGGSRGVTLPIPTWDPDLGNAPFYYSMLLLLVLTLGLCAWIRRTKFGTGLIAIREDENKAASIGIHTNTYKTLSFMASGVMVGIAGGVYAYFLTFIDPRGMFDILISVSILLAALVGGKGTVWGPLVGAFIVQFLNEATNVYANGSQLRLILFGGLLMATVMFVPRGLLPTLKEWLTSRKAKERPVESIDQGTIAGKEAAVRLVRKLEPRSGHDLLVGKGLVKTFGRLAAVDGCDLEVAEGSITGLIGPNGSGKTTLFNLLTGMVRPDAGEIYLDGRRMDRLPPWDRSHAGLGRSWQTTRLFNDMTVLENVVAPMPDFRWRRLAASAVGGQEAERARELLDFVGMAKLSEARAGHLSFGQRKLVELAQVLMMEPRMILLDEPAGGINPALVERIVSLVRDLNGQGITFLIVEHNMPVVLDLCDPVIVLAAGRRICAGPPSEVQQDPAVLDAYLGEDWTAVETEAPV